MRLVINGRFLSQRITGVQRMAREFTRALDRLIAKGELPGVEARILVPPNASLGDLALGAIPATILAGAQNHVWEQLLLPRHLNGDVLLNLGNTMPVALLSASNPVAVVLHDISFRLHPEAYKHVYRFGHRLLNSALMGRADPIITVSESERETILHFYPKAASRVIVAQNGSWTGDEVAPVRELHPREPAYGLYVGSLSRRKNVQGVLAAATELARSRGLPFKIVGAKSPILAELSTILPDDVRGGIEFCGQIDDPEALKALYRNASFLLFPSFYEASALPPLEAMAQRCPVVVSDIPSLIERCGDAALYCQPEDIGSMVSAATRLLDDRRLAAELADKGEIRARRYTWRTQAQSIVAAIQRRYG